MAYNRLAGMIPEVWSGLLLSRLHEALVFQGVANTDYQGEITAFGDTVKINEIGPITINDYSSTSTSALTIQSLSDAQKELKIDRAKTFAFWVDALDTAQIKPKVMSEAMSEAAFAAANEIDEYIATLHTDAGITVDGTSATGVDITSTNVLKYLSIAAQKLDEANVPEIGRYAICPPWFVHKMQLANIVLNTDNSNAVRRGFMGQDMYGFDIFKSNNVVNGTPAADDARILFGYNKSISMATQIVDTESGRPMVAGGGFKSLVKGLFVYGAKVVRPNTFAVLYADYTAEAT